MAYTFSFEKLNVWIDSKELVKLIYGATRKFPEEEKFGLTNQMRRASISISSNLQKGPRERQIKIRLISQQFLIAL